MSLFIDHAHSVNTMIAIFECKAIKCNWIIHPKVML